MSESILSVGFIKSILPTVIGASVSLWYERDSLKWEQRNNKQKLVVVLFSILAWMVTIITAWYLGGAVIEYFNVARGTFTANAINIVVALHILKIISISQDRIEIILQMIFDGFTKIVKGFFNLGD